MAKLHVSEVKAIEAFEHYYKQGLEGLGGRSFKATAEALGLPVATIKKIAKDDDWESKIAQRGAIITEQVEERVNEKVGDVKADYHVRIRKVISAWFEKHFGKDGPSELMLLTMDADDLIKLIKLDLTLMGEPEVIKRVDQKLTVNIDDQLNALTTEELRAIVESRQKALPAVEAEIVQEGKQENG